MSDSIQKSYTSLERVVQGTCDNEENKMKKSVMCILIFCFVMGVVGAVGNEDLFDLVVPYGEGELSVAGSLFSTPAGGGSDNVFELRIDTGASSFSLGGAADYYYAVQSLEDLLIVDVGGSLELSSSGAVFRSNSNQQIVYRQYGYEIGDMTGFLAAGGSYGGSLSSSSWFNVNPYAGIGIGRVHLIQPVIRAEIMMKHLGVEPTKQRIENVASLLIRSAAYQNKFSENRADEIENYWQEVASAMGLPGQGLKVLALASSQEYAFEVARYAGLVSGWEGLGYFKADIEKTTSLISPWSFYAALAGTGTYSGFLTDMPIYYRADGTVEFGYGNSTFDATVNISGDVRYFPEAPEWWAEASLTTRYSLVSGFYFKVLGEAYYMLNPNFTVNASVGLGGGVGFTVSAGANYRIW